MSTATTSTTSTLSEYLRSQSDLVQEAAEALPHAFSQCTYPLGHIRQAVYLCTTCPEARGICAACSIACHTDHEQIELFPKRNFRCDCPTSAIAHPCHIRSAPEPENEKNAYNQNFKGVFCRCGRPYDAKTERETMIQCLACEDWFHESCCNLRERPSESTSENDGQQPNGDHVEEHPNRDSSVPDDADTHSEASSSGLPPPLILADDYEAFVCRACVSSIPTLSRYAGTPGTLMVVRDSVEQPWTVLREPEGINGEANGVHVEVVEEGEASAAGTKRSSPPPNDDQSGPVSKKAKLSPPLDADASTRSSPCLAPPHNARAQGVLKSSDHSFGKGDLFLTDGFRDRWCHCSSCLPSLRLYPFFLEEEDTYEPPEDPDSGLSLEELGMRALQLIPRERAIEGIHAFNAMRDDLVKYLKPFAQEGKVVDEGAIKEFFEKLKEGKGESG